MSTVAHAADPLLVGLPEIAELAGVRRPVVTMWRKRFAAGADAFPLPHSSDGREWFDVDEVARWLIDTGHGNNPDAIADASRFARVDLVDTEDIDSVTALLALRAANAAPLTGLDAENLIDLADEIDPDDEHLFREIEQLAERSVQLAPMIDRLVGGEYSAASVFERMLRHSTIADRSRAAMTISAEASALIAELAIELSRTNSEADAAEPRFSDPLGTAADSLIEIATRVDETAMARVSVAVNDEPATRMLRRRLLVHRIAREYRDDGASDAADVSGPVVHVLRFSNTSTQSARDALEAIERVALGMSDDQRAVALAPAAVLVDELRGDDDRVRSAVLRSGRVRCVIRLPEGLVPAHPRQALALWVLGPAHAHIAISERWTMLADLTAHELSPSTRLDLVVDVAASMGDRRTISAHPFWFAKLVLTRELLARRGSLLDPGSSVSHTPAVGEWRRKGDAAAELDALADTLGDLAPVALREAVPPRTARRLAPARLGDLVRERHARLVVGTRVDRDHVTTDGFRVIGAEELTGALPAGSRRIDRLAFAAKYPSARLTEPGDVVFIVGPTPRAWVDREGSSVVAYPARSFRINADDPGGLIADVLAADIRRQRAGQRDWRAWTIRRVVVEQRRALEAVLGDIRSKRLELEASLARLDRLSAVTMTAVTDGAVELPQTNDDH